MVTLWQMDGDVRLRAFAGLFTPQDIKCTSAYGAVHPLPMPHQD